MHRNDRELLHELNQRYRLEFDRAERLQAELDSILNSRLGRLFLSLRRLVRWFRTPSPSAATEPPLAPPALLPPTSSDRSNDGSSSTTVSIIIPFKDRGELLWNCLRRLRSLEHFEIVLVDNGSRDAKLLARIDRLVRHSRGRVRLVSDPLPFNFSRLCNLGARHARGTHLLFLNNDIEARDTAWLKHMLALADRPEIGIVGATLLYPDGSLQHAGLEPTCSGTWHHPRRGELPTCLPVGAWPVSAVTGACLLIRRDRFEALDGFDERLPVTHNDVELCERARAHGWKVVVTSQARLLHFESLSRGYTNDPRLRTSPRPFREPFWRHVSRWLHRQEVHHQPTPLYVRAFGWLWRSARWCFHFLLGREAIQSTVPPGSELHGVPGHLTGSNREYWHWQKHAQPTNMRGTSSETRISVVMPVYRPRLQDFQEAVDSVLAQTHEHWELCICLDGPSDARVSRYLESLAEREPRVRITSHEVNRGISAATNSAIGLASGTWVAFLDQDDRLAPEALAEVAAAAQANENADVIYSDWDRIDDQGCRVEPFFKPDFSDALLTSMMYLAHLTVYRRTLLDRIGLCRTEFDGAQDWDLALRAVEQARQVVHLPKVLYHWRMGGNSAGKTFNRLCHERGKRAVTEALRRRGFAHRVQDGPTPCTFHVRPTIVGSPRVSILIPTRNNRPLLERCLRSIRKRTRGIAYEILVLDNGSTDASTLHYLANCGERVVRLEMPFNHSRLNNLGAQSASGDLLLLLNDDTEVITGEWLAAMSEQVQAAEVGAVGALLFHPDDRVQHAGIVLGVGPVASNLHHGLLCDGLDRGMIRHVREVSAVSGACLLVRRAVFEELGGLDEADLPTSFNDVDFCLRLRKAGYRCVVTPLARLYHHESATRRIGLREGAYLELMQSRWGIDLHADPFWNPNLPHGPKLDPFFKRPVGG